MKGLKPVGFGCYSAGQNTVHAMLWTSYDASRGQVVGNRIPINKGYLAMVEILGVLCGAIVILDTKLLGICGIKGIQLQRKGSGRNRTLASSRGACVIQSVSDGNNSG